jgi:6-carboxyhexanoate--CoA ligase
MESIFYSVRMRASSQGRHCSGAERIVPREAVAETSSALLMRAFSNVSAEIDQASCQVERIVAHELCFAGLPDVITYPVDNVTAGRSLAHRLLCRAGVAEEVATTALQLLARGAGPAGQVMRGAVLMDASSGRRLEEDPARGVRVSRMDAAPEFQDTLQANLRHAGLEHFRVREALLLAGKVLGAPGLIAELCWSDDPGYMAGYVAVPGTGYQRISRMKETGDRRGGRIFFLRSDAVAVPELVAYLERTPVLFNRMGCFTTVTDWQAR